MAGGTVTRLPKDPGPAGWNEILPKAPPPEPLEEQRTADWLVIGAGFAGLAAARRLNRNRPGESVVVLEASRIGQGPAGRNSGFMIDLPHDLSSANYGGAAERDRKQIAANRTAIAFAAEAAADYGLPDEAFRPAGKVNAAASERGLAHNQDFAGHLEGLGEAYELLDAQAMQDLTGSRYYQGGLYTAGSALIQPALFVRGVAGGLASNRVKLHETSPVLALTRQEGLWQAETPQGLVRAPKVILAVNGHAESFGYFRRRLIHVFTYASMTRALRAEEVKALGGQPGWGLTPADPLGTTLRRITSPQGERIVVRNRFTYDPGLEISEKRLAASVKDHDAAFAARFPALAGIEMEYRWGGRLCLSRNDAPAFGMVEEGLYAACCQNGLGTARGTFAGVAAADLACGVSSSFTQHMVEAPEPTAKPPEPITLLGASARIAWGQFRAGREL
ncbi:MAG: FAD-binding oxidoreductase [Pseudomonadota bacterium]